MKKLFILMLLINFATLSFAQTKATNKTTLKKPKIEDVLNQQVELLNARIDSMTVVHTNIIAANAKYIDSMTIAHNNAIELVRNEQKEHYANYYNQLDSNNNTAWVILSLIWGAISAVFGIVIPLILNNKSEERVNTNVKELKDQVQSDTKDLKQQLRISLHNNAKAQDSRNKLFAKILSKQIEGQSDTLDGRIAEQKDYVNGIKTEVEAYLTQSRIQGLLTTAQNSLKKDPKYAIELYTEVLDIESTNEDALLWRGIAYCIVRDSKKSLEDLCRLVKLHPRQARAYNNIGNVYLSDKQYKLALKNYNTALKINPKYAGVYSNIASMYSEQEKYKKALEYCDKALEIDDEMIKAHRQRILICAKLAKLSKDDATKQKYIDIIKQENIIVNILKEKYLSELMSS